MTSAIVTPAGWLAGLLDAIGAARQGRKWQCPVHGLDGEHSVALSVGDRRDGSGAWLYCHAGCELAVLLRALHLTRADLRMPPPVDPRRHARAFRLVRQFPPPKSAGSPGGGGFRFEAEHGYGEPEPFAWKIRLRHPASGAKEVAWESLNPRGERVPSLLGRREVDMPLYRIREVRMAVSAGELLVLVESESSVDALTSAGVYATTWAGGASSPPLERLRGELSGADVLLVPDHDDAGLACAERILGVLPSARVQLGEPGEDARDILARCGAGWFR